jgi:hypothetical protein
MPIAAIRIEGDAGEGIVGVAGGARLPPVRVPYRWLIEPELGLSPEVVTVPRSSE